MKKWNRLQSWTRMKDIITARMNSLYSLQTGNQSLKNNMEKIVRPKKDGCYEIISEYRRKFAAEKIGYRKVPVIIRVLKDDEAVVLMVDSNLQREMISPSEKAFAYKMKYEAIKRKVGRRKCGQVDHNLGKKSIELIGEECGDSPKQVQLHRFFPVTYTAEQMRREILEMLKLNMKKYWDA